MERTQQPALIYAGIGARATPDSVLADMTKMAGWLALAGILQAAARLEQIRCSLMERRQAVRPSACRGGGYNHHAGAHCHILSPAELSSCIDIASKMHPAWSRCSPTVRKLHARNVAILLGRSLDRPVDAVVCWTDRGAIAGGTGMALRIAAEYRIPVINLGTYPPARLSCDWSPSLWNQANDYLRPDASRFLDHLYQPRQSHRCHGSRTR